MRVQNTCEDEAASGQEFESTLILPGSDALCRALAPEWEVSYRDRLHIHIKAQSLKDLRAKINSLLRVYQALYNLEVVL